MSRIVFIAEQSYIEHIDIITGHIDSNMHANKYGNCITCKKCISRKLDAFRCLVCDEYDHVSCSKMALTPVEISKHQSPSFRFEYLCCNCRVDVISFKRAVISHKLFPSPAADTSVEVKQLREQLKKHREIFAAQKNELANYHRNEISSIYDQTKHLVSIHDNIASTRPTDLEKKLSSISQSHGELSAENKSLRDECDAIKRESSDMFHEVCTEIDRLKQKCLEHDQLIRSRTYIKAADSTLMSGLDAVKCSDKSSNKSIRAEEKSCDNNNTHFNTVPDVSRKAAPSIYSPIEYLKSTFAMNISEKTTPEKPAPLPPMPNYSTPESPRSTSNTVSSRTGTIPKTQSEYQLKMSKMVNNCHYRATYLRKNELLWKQYLPEITYVDVHRAIVDLATQNCLVIDTNRSLHSIAIYLSPIVLEMVSKFMEGEGKPAAYNNVVNYFNTNVNTDAQEDGHVRMDMFRSFANIMDMLLARLVFRYVGCTFKHIDEKSRGERYFVSSLFDLSELISGKDPVPSYMLHKCLYPSNRLRRRSIIAICHPAR